MRTSHRGQTENWLLLKCFNGKIWPLRCFSRKIDSFYPCVTNEKARNTLVILKKWQTSVLCVCKKGLGKVKNRNTLVFISNAIDHVEKCSFAPTAPDRSHWRSLWHLALRHLTVWRSVHFQTPVLSVERQGPPRLSIREGGRERERGGGGAALCRQVDFHRGWMYIQPSPWWRKELWRSAHFQTSVLSVERRDLLDCPLESERERGGSGALSSGRLPQRMDVHPTLSLVKKNSQFRKIRLFISKA